MKYSLTQKSIILFLTAATVLSLAGCGGSKTEGSPPSSVPYSNISEAPVTSKNAQSETISHGFTFVHQGVRIDIDAEASSIIRALGEPVSYFEAASCVFDGQDKMYTYGSFELDTYPTDGKDYVSAVIFRDDSIATAEGLMIGDSVKTLRQVYGEPSSSSEALIAYEAGSMELRFILEGDAIAAIEYISLAAEG